MSDIVTMFKYAAFENALVDLEFTKIFPPSFENDG
jgi:hypothetical protein